MLRVALEALAEPVLIDCILILTRIFLLRLQLWLDEAVLTCLVLIIGDVLLDQVREGAVRLLLGLTAVRVLSFD